MGDPIRSVVIGRDDSARATIRSDDSFTSQSVLSGDAAFALPWKTASAPAENNSKAAASRSNGEPLLEVQP